jgi:hypothetical protein
MEQSFQALIHLLNEHLRGRRQLAEIATDGAADFRQLDVAALHVRRQAAQHVTELLLVELLFLGKFPGAHQPLEARMLRDHGQVHQLESAGEGDRDGSSGYKRKRCGAAERDPVVLDIESFFDEVDVLLRRIRAGRIRQART